MDTLPGTPPPPVTPLPKHHGAHGGIIALTLLIATTVVVWTTQPAKHTAPTVEAAKPAASMMPVASTVPREPEQPVIRPVSMTPDIKTAVAVERELPHVVSATGPLGYDESRTHHMAVPVAGLLQKSRAASVGRYVRAGETLGVIYSPDVYLATVDLLAEIRNFKTQEQLDRQRVRLLRWGVSRQWLAKVEQANKPTAVLPLIARNSGIIVAEQARQKQLVDPNAGFELYTITDPTYAWVYVDVPAGDASRAKLGQTARVSVEKITQPLTGTIGYIARRAEDGMKTMRFDLHSYALKMPPAVNAKVELTLANERGPVIPAAAVQKLADRTIVYVVKGKVAEPRDVGLGPMKGELVMIDHGIATGDTVAIVPKR